MGRDLGTVSKGVKDLWLLCGEGEGTRGRVAGRGRASPQGERGLGQAKGAEIGRWVGRSQRDPQSIQHR